jgi:hypothetical protein
MSANLLMLILLKTDFLLVGLPQQLSKLNNPTVNVTSSVTLSPVPHAESLTVLFDSNLSLCGRISYVTNTKSCFSNIRDLRHIALILHQTTARNIATMLLSILSLTTSCNTLLLKFPANQLNCLLLVLNFAARPVTITPRFHHITHILKSHNWLKIFQRIIRFCLSLGFIPPQYIFLCSVYKYTMFSYKRYCL